MVTNWPWERKLIADEIGELDEQLPGAVGIGTHEGFDCRQGVVDEVWRDLCAEEPQFGLHGAPARAVQLGQLELGRDELSHLAAETEQTGRGRRDPRRRERRRCSRRW